MLALTGQAAAGWYQVKNFEGSVGPSPVHLSLQRYDSFGSGITVEGSYFYDAKQSPIALYGKSEGTKLTLCEIADDKELDRVLVMGSKTPIDATGCPLSLDLHESGATGIWVKGSEKVPVVLKQVAALDDTAEAKINGIVEIPFWVQTATHRLAGVYTKTDAGICMTKLQVISKKTRKAVQSIRFDDEDCNAGMLMTPIYLNVQKQGEEIISVNFRGGNGGYTTEYGFSPKTGTYHRLVN
ncbi:hypothetical protein FJ987_21960 [Mesorhizobium sp. CU2]|uniref:hypothetical protein n=1 Tax=unclassified Mesorhizobium TaxID=325217 RepID=UPI00112D3730|nr:MULTISPECIES: hypothetical protein [unclassified Mesorhizobium]TPN81810.1 hypothetical protein FJ988_16530 [Mesorhizobium sp. CU3]TPO10014.1 hypothetical protein FJ987_21960 [Mesorhizobium sp. CU2]